MKIMNLYWTHNDDEKHNMFTKHKYTWLLRYTLLNERQKTTIFDFPHSEKYVFLFEIKSST